jgi:hypothetical protein
MTVYWSCRTCGAAGEGDKAAEQHVRDTAHTTETYARPWPPVFSIPLTLTDQGWAAASQGWSA